MFQKTILKSNYFLQKVNYFIVLEIFWIYWYRKVNCKLSQIVLYDKRSNFRHASTISWTSEIYYMSLLTVKYIWHFKFADSRRFRRSVRANLVIEHCHSQLFEVASKNRESIYIECIDVYLVCICVSTLSANNISKVFLALSDFRLFSRRCRTSFFST